MALVLDSEDFRTVALTGGEIGITRLELQVKTFTTGLTIIVLELDFAVNAPVGVWGRAKNLSCLIRARKPTTYRSRRRRNLITSSLR